MPNREGGYGGYQSSQPQQNRMPRKVNAPGSGKVRRGVDPAGLGAQRPPQRTLPLPGAFTFLGILFCCGWLLW